MEARRSPLLLVVLLLAFITISVVAGYVATQLNYPFINGATMAIFLQLLIIVRLFGYKILDKLKDLSKLPPRALLNLVNVPKHISIHLFGEKHTKGHHMIIGLVIMFAAIFVIHYHTGHYGLMDIAIETLGAGLHGVGLTPWIDALAKSE